MQFLLLTFLQSFIKLLYTPIRLERKSFDSTGHVPSVYYGFHQRTLLIQNSNSATLKNVEKQTPISKQNPTPIHLPKLEFTKQTQDS